MLVKLISLKGQLDELIQKELEMRHAFSCCIQHDNLEDAREIGKRIKKIKHQIIDLQFVINFDV